MKNVSISLTDQHAAEIQAEIATGDYASVSEVIRAALRDFMDRPIGPSHAQMEKDYLEYRARLDAGEEVLLTVDEAMDDILKQMRE